jgi:tetratricopeptide (TPR) repeat protein
MSSPEPISARILPFRLPKQALATGAAEVEAMADDFLNSGKFPSDAAEILNPDVLFAVVARLREKMNSSPGEVATQLVDLHNWMSSTEKRIGLFDERDYLLGELALIGSTVFRHLGQHNAAENWLESADSSYRHTVNPAPLLSKVAYSRLALRYDQRKYDALLHGLPSLLRSFEQLGMEQELAKARLLEIATFKELGRTQEAVQRLSALRATLRGDGFGLLGFVLTEIGAERARQGNHGEALEAYQEALSLLENGPDRMALGHLKGTVGESYRATGQLGPALEMFRSALREFERLEMPVRATYYRVAIADVLLAADRPREAEWELMTALPSIERLGMVPEGFAAVALLKEAVRRRQVNPATLGALREHLSTAK